MTKLRKIFTICFSIIVLTVSIGCSVGLTIYFLNKQNNHLSQTPDFKPDPSLPDNKIDFETWTNEENKSNKFSTVASNGKLNIVDKRGADDIYDADFNDGRGNCNPLLGNIINDQYRRLAEISFSLNFVYGNGNYLGTAWILDYEIPSGINEKDEGNTYDATNYPTKWYLATNSHVMDDLKTPTSIYKETNTSHKLNASTDSVVLKKIKQPTLGTDNGMYKKSSYNNPSYKTFWFHMMEDFNTPLKMQPVRPVFLGFDYLKSSPSDFINNVPQPTNIPSDVQFEKVEEMADFSVFEIDFNKVNMDIFSDYKSPNELAMVFSSNYANWKESEKFKPAPHSLLVDQSNKNNQYYALGFPQEAAIGGPRGTGDVALFINRPEDISTQQYPYGSHLVLERHYNTFKNTPGIFDLTIGSADFGYRFDPISSTVSSSGIIPYLYQGLSYTDQNGDMQVGSSGSIFVDQNNYIYGIHFASDFTAHVGINFALKCEGYNYKGAYGNYNLQPYDLINGGYDNQKQSYKSQLKKLYPNGIRTHIFKNGI